MNKLEFLSTQLLYGLRVFANQQVNMPNGFVFNSYRYCSYVGDIMDFTPIIRHIDSLTRECVQADYNEGKPFVPIVELLKAIYPIKDEYKGTVYEIIDIDRSGYPRAYYRHLATRDIIINPFDANSMPHWVVQQLLKWHYWPNKPESEEVIWVTSEFNPYK